MTYRAFIERIKKKIPSCLPRGFFSFFAGQLLFFYLLQQVSRFIFIFHRAGEDSSLLSFWETAVHGFKLDLAMCAYIMLPILLFYLTALVFARWQFLYAAFALAMFFVLATSIISFADAEMFRVWGSKFNRQALDYMQRPKEAMASSAQAAWVRIFIWVLLIVVIAFWVYRKLFVVAKRQITNKRWLQLPYWAVFFVLGGVAVRGGLQTVPITQSAVYYSDKNFRNLAAVNSPWNFLYYVVNKSDPIDPETYHFDKSADEAWKLYTQQDTSSIHICRVEKPNVVFIVLESFSAYVSKFFGKVYNQTPFLDSLAATGWSFSHAYSQGDRTDKGLACIIGGWPGQPWQSILNEPDKAAKLPSIASVFAKQGYSTSFWYGGDMGFANMRAYISNAGFSKISEVGDYEDKAKESKWGVHDEFVFRHFIEGHRNASKPFFSMILTLSSHEPFDVPGSEGKHFKDEYAKFLNSVSYTDRCLSSFFQAAAKESWFANTLFVLVADHGRDIGLEGMNYSQPKHFSVPIVFWGPALQPGLAGKKDSVYCSQTDIGSTLAAGVLGEKGIFPYGRNLALDHASMSAYFFSSGFGVVSPLGHIVWENKPPRVAEEGGNPKPDMLRVGQSLQYEVIIKYKKF